MAIFEELDNRTDFIFACSLSLCLTVYHYMTLGSNTESLSPTPYTDIKLNNLPMVVRYEYDGRGDRAPTWTLGYGFSVVISCNLVVTSVFNFPISKVWGGVEGNFPVSNFRWSGAGRGVLTCRKYLV